MSIIKKLIILIIFVIFSFILYRLMATRRAIKAEYGIEGFREGYSVSEMDAELAVLKTSNVPASTSDATNLSLPLKQYCIKAAYNAPLTGYYVNTEMIKYLFYRGCRFLDFEIFSFDEEPYVAMSTNPSYDTINTTNKLTLNDVISTITTYAFSAPSPISRDPLFIHLRIKTNIPNKLEVYNKIADGIRNVLRPVDKSGKVIEGYRMYADTSGNALPVTGDTILKDIRDKIIVVLDKSYLSDNYKINSPKLASIVNMESGYEILRKHGYSELSQQKNTSPFVYSDGITTDVSIMQMVMPDMNGSIISKEVNQIYHQMVLNYGVQIVLDKFYIKNDQYLGDYERAFADNKSAFVPMGTMVTYLKTKVGGDESVKPKATDISGAKVPLVNPFASKSDASLDTKKDTDAPNLDNVKQNLKNMVSSIFK